MRSHDENLERVDQVDLIFLRRLHDDLAMTLRIRGGGVVLLNDSATDLVAELLRLASLGVRAEARPDSGQET